MPRTKYVTNEQWLARVRAWQASGQRTETFCLPPRGWGRTRTTPLRVLNG